MRSHFAIAAALAISAVSGQALAQDFDIMQMADTNKDGKVSLTEFSALTEQGWGFFSQGAEQVKVADLDPMAKGAFAGIAPDANGVVTHKAYSDAQPGRFKALDKDSDGALTSAELMALMQPPA